MEEEQGWGEGGHQIRDRSVTCYDSGSVRVVAASAFPVPDARRSNEYPKTFSRPQFDHSHGTKVARPFGCSAAVQ